MQKLRRELDRNEAEALEEVIEIKKSDSGYRYRCCALILLIVGLIVAGIFGYQMILKKIFEDNEGITFPKLVLYFLYNKVEYGTRGDGYCFEYGGKALDYPWNDGFSC